MKKTTPTFRAVSIAAVLLAAGAGTSYAQNALGDGQVLDRSLQQGSGGRNTPVRDLNALIRFNNSVVTGNAGGGKAFRGNSGYLATDDFRGALGSDALFNFRRDAAPSAVPVIAGIRGTDALRYQFALTTGQAAPGLGNLDFSRGLSRGANPIHTPGVISSVERDVTTSGAVSSALRSTADYTSQQTLRPTVLGYRQLTDGRQAVMTASPLLGVNSTVTGTAAGETPTDQPGAFPNTGPLNGMGVDEVTPNVNPLNLVESMATTRVQSRVETPKAVMDQFRRAVDSGATDSSTSSSLTPLPGTTPDDKGAAPKRNFSDWEVELDRIRKHLSGESAAIDPNAPPSEEQVIRPGSLQDLISPETGKVDIEVLKALQATRPLLVRLAPETAKPADTYSAHMKNGENLLAQGRFFDAEDAFIRALASAPKDPLANVGRVHAELGAGLFLSAAANLKAFFIDQPTMIGARYAAALTPSADRAATLTSQLRNIVRTPTSGVGKEAGMLLAYIGYQRGDADQVKEGLEAMAEKTYPEQTGDVLLLGLLQKIWVEGRDLPPETLPAKEALQNPTTPAPAADQNK